MTSGRPAGLITRRRIVGTLAAAVVIALAARRELSPERTTISLRPVPRPAEAQEPAAEPAPSAPDTMAAEPPLGSGSAAVLAALWTTEALAVRSGDARIVRQRPADHTPPDRVSRQYELPPLPASQTGSIRRVSTRGNAKLVALTFDLCERADDVTGYDGAIVDLLRAGRVPATFFAGGKWMRSHAERAMQMIADPLFEIGNHGWTHGNLRVLDGEAAERQIIWPLVEYELLRDRLVERATAKGIDVAEINRIPVSMRTFRFPYGTCSEESLAMVGRLGMAAIQWDVISGDAVKKQSADVVRRAVVDQVKPGSIVVFHANGRGSGTSAALPAIIRTLDERGYKFVTVSHLLDAGQPVAFKECYELRPGDNQRYDRLFGDGTG
jgi:Predicted xylanase/chitin deacetylase